MGRSCGKMRDEGRQRHQKPMKWRERVGDEDRECDGKTALTEIWKSGRRMEKYNKGWKDVVAVERERIERK